MNYSVSIPFLKFMAPPEKSRSTKLATIPETCSCAEVSDGFNTATQNCNHSTCQDCVNRQFSDLSYREKQLQRRIEESEQNKQEFVAMLREANNMINCATQEQHQEDQITEIECQQLAFQNEIEKLESSFLDRHRKSEQLQKDLCVIISALDSKTCSDFKDDHLLETQLKCPCRDHDHPSENENFDRTQKLYGAMGDYEEIGKQHTFQNFEEDTFEELARRISRSLLEIEQCHDCNAELSEDLKETIMGIKQLLDLLHQLRLKKERQFICSSKERLAGSISSSNISSLNHIDASAISAEVQIVCADSFVSARTHSQISVELDYTTCPSSITSLQEVAEGSGAVVELVDTEMGLPVELHESVVPCESSLLLPCSDLTTEAAIDSTSKLDESFTKPTDTTTALDEHEELVSEAAVDFTCRLEETSNESMDIASLELSEETFEATHASTYSLPEVSIKNVEDVNLATADTFQELQDVHNKKSETCRCIASSPDNALLEEEVQEVRNAIVAMVEEENFKVEQDLSTDFQKCGQPDKQDEAVLQKEESIKLDVQIERRVGLYEETNLIKATITKSGNLEVITKSDDTVVESTITYSKSGNVNITTEIIQYDNEDFQESTIGSDSECESLHVIMPPTTELSFQSTFIETVIPPLQTSSFVSNPAAVETSSEDGEYPVMGTALSVSGVIRHEDSPVRLENENSIMEQSSKELKTITEETNFDQKLSPQNQAPMVEISEQAVIETVEEFYSIIETVDVATESSNMERETAVQCHASIPEDGVDSASNIKLSTTDAPDHMIDHEVVEEFKPSIIIHKESKPENDTETFSRSETKVASQTETIECKQIDKVLQINEIDEESELEELLSALQCIERYDEATKSASCTMALEERASVSALGGEEFPETELLSPPPIQDAKSEELHPATESERMAKEESAIIHFLVNSEKESEQKPTTGVVEDTTKSTDTTPSFVETRVKEIETQIRRSQEKTSIQTVNSEELTAEELHPETESGILAKEGSTINIFRVNSEEEPAQKIAADVFEDETQSTGTTSSVVETRVKEIETQIRLSQEKAAALVAEIGQHGEESMALIEEVLKTEPIGEFIQFKTYQKQTLTQENKPSATTHKIIEEEPMDECISKITVPLKVIDTQFEPYQKQTSAQENKSSATTQETIEDESIDETPFAIASSKKFDVHKQVEDALNKANKLVMDSLLQTRINITEVLEKVNRNVETVIAQSIKVPPQKVNKQVTTEGDYLRHSSVFDSVPKDCQHKMVPLSIRGSAYAMETTDNKEEVYQNLGRCYSWPLDRSLSLGRDFWRGAFIQEEEADIPRVPIFAAKARRSTDFDCNDVCGRSYRKKLKEQRKNAVVLSRESDEYFKNDEIRFIHISQWEEFAEETIRIEEELSSQMEKQNGEIKLNNDEIESALFQGITELTISVSNVGNEGQVILLCNETFPGEEEISISSDLIKLLSETDVVPQKGDSEIATVSEARSIEIFKLMEMATSLHGNIAEEDTIEVLTSPPERVWKVITAELPIVINAEDSLLAAQNNATVLDQTPTPLVEDIKRELIFCSDTNSSPSETEVTLNKPEKPIETVVEDTKTKIIFSRFAEETPPLATENTIITDKESSTNLLLEIVSKDAENEPTPTVQDKNYTAQQKTKPDFSVQPLCPEEEDGSRKISQERHSRSSRRASKKVTQEERRTSPRKRPKSSSDQKTDDRGNRRSSRKSSVKPEEKSKSLDAVETKEGKSKSVQQVRRLPSEVKPTRKPDRTADVHVFGAKRPEVKCDCSKCDCEICSLEKIKQKQQTRKLEELDDCTCLPSCGCAVCSAIPKDVKLSEEMKSSGDTTHQQQQSNICETQQKHPPGYECVDALCDPQVVAKEVPILRHPELCDCLFCRCCTCSAGIVEETKNKFKHEQCSIITDTLQTSTISNVVSDSRTLTESVTKKLSVVEIPYSSNEESRTYYTDIEIISLWNDSTDHSANCECFASLHKEISTEGCRCPQYTRAVSSKLIQEVENEKLLVDSNNQNTLSLDQLKNCISPIHSIVSQQREDINDSTSLKIEINDVDEEICHLKNLSVSQYIPTSFPMLAADAQTLKNVNNLQEKFNMPTKDTHDEENFNYSCPAPTEEPQKVADSFEIDFNNQKQIIINLQEAIKEAGSICRDVEYKTLNSTPVEKSFMAVQKSSFRLTLSGLRLAICALQDKCRKKDRMIATMLNELKLRTDSAVLRNVRDALSTQNLDGNPIDYDRTGICKSLPRPTYEIQDPIQCILCSDNPCTSTVIEIASQNIDTIEELEINEEFIKAPTALSSSSSDYAMADEIGVSTNFNVEEPTKLPKHVDSREKLATPLTWIPLQYQHTEESRSSDDMPVTTNQTDVVKQGAHSLPVCPCLNFGKKRKPRSKEHKTTANTRHPCPKHFETNRKSTKIRTQSCDQPRALTPYPKELRKDYQTLETEEIVKAGKSSGGTSCPCTKYSSKKLHSVRKHSYKKRCEHPIHIDMQKFKEEELLHIERSLGWPAFGMSYLNPRIWRKQ